MPRFNRLLLPLATTALLIAGTAHAEARRSGQSMPSPARFSPPAPVKMEPARGGVSQRGDGPGRDRNDHGKFDNRRYDHDRDDYERGKEHEGHRFEHHHDRDDSPGC